MQEPRNFLPLRLAVALYFWKEERRVKRLYYGNSSFRAIDLALKRAYRWKNPYAISRRFLQKRGADDPYTYGETPLTSLEEIGKRLELSPQDTFIDLGCGRGRGVFFMASRFGCKAVGIDWVPEFIEIAEHMAQKTRGSVAFYHGEIGSSSLCDLCALCGKKSSVAEPRRILTTESTESTEEDSNSRLALYLAWTCMEEEEREAIEEALGGLEAARIVTVSYPLASQKFVLQGSCELSFPWGMARVFFHKKC